MLNSIEALLDEWRWSAKVMHQGHHRAASRAARFHKWWGGTVAGLGALVASSLFVAISNSADTSGNNVVIFFAGLVSMGSAVLTGVNSALDWGGREQRHYTAAVAFQGLLREIEEELVQCKNGRSKDSYEHLRNRWTTALEVSLPLPQHIYNEYSVKVKTDRRNGQSENTK